MDSGNIKAWRIIANIRAWLIGWWPFITIAVWGLIFTGMVAFGNIMLQLSDSISRLAGSLSASKSYQLYLKEQINSTNRDVRENAIHLEAQSQRVDVLQSRIDQLYQKKSGKKADSKQFKRGVVIREYYIESDTIKPQPSVKDSLKPVPPSPQQKQK